MRTGHLALVGAFVVAVPATAHAGRSFFGWVDDTQVMPERGAEIQSWLHEENGLHIAGNDDYRAHWTSWGANALIGVTDQLELGFPIEMLWKRVEDNPGSFTLQQYGIEARYRMVASDSDDPPPFAPLVRVALKRDVITRDAVVGEANLVLSTTNQSGSVVGVIDAGFQGLYSDDAGNHSEFRPAAGVSFKVHGDLRLGAEGYAELSLDDKKKSWAVVGPNMSWTQGRFWISGAFGIGVYQIKTAPKVTWGIMSDADAALTSDARHARRSRARWSGDGRHHRDR